MAFIKKYRIAKGQKHYVRQGKGLVCHTEGQIIELSDAQAKPIMDKLVPMDQTPAEIEDAQDLEQSPPEYMIKHQGSGRYNVLNVAENRAVNERLLSREEADKMYNELTGKEAGDADREDDDDDKKQDDED